MGSVLRTDLILCYSVEVSERLLENVLPVPSTLVFSVKFALSVDFSLYLSQFLISNRPKLGRLVQIELRFGVEQDHTRRVPS